MLLVEMTENFVYIIKMRKKKIDFNLILLARSMLREKTDQWWADSVLLQLKFNRQTFYSLCEHVV